MDTARLIRSCAVSSFVQLNIATLLNCLSHRFLHFLSRKVVDRRVSAHFSYIDTSKLAVPVRQAEVPIAFLDCCPITCAVFLHLNLEPIDNMLCDFSHVQGYTRNR